MIFIGPITLATNDVTLVPLGVEHEAGLRLAAADGAGDVGAGA